ncbi:hypothetical protein DL93DRAFT_2153406, partial [Clavulina sp. PMI_390]
MPDQLRPLPQDDNADNAPGRFSRSPLAINSRASDAAQRASRLLDVSPPHFGMSGLTSDSDFGPPQQHLSLQNQSSSTSARRRDPHASASRERDDYRAGNASAIARATQSNAEPNGDSGFEHKVHDVGASATVDDSDEWDFSEVPPESDGQQQWQRAPTSVTGSSAQAWSPTNRREKPSPLQISVTPSAPSEGSRSRGRTSSDASSSLDPYYYGFTSSREGSPYDQDPPPLPAESAAVIASASSSHSLPPRKASTSTTSSYHQRWDNSDAPFEPKTPSRDASAIDRQGLVGVGELATPRWVSSDSSTGARETRRNRPKFNVESTFAPYDATTTPSWGTSIFNDQDSSDYDLVNS